MPFLLRKTAANTSATVSISPRISHMVSSHASFTGDWELFLDCDVTAPSFPALGLGGSGVRLLFFTNLTTLRLARAAGNVDFTLPVSAAGRHEYRIVGSSATNTVEVFQDNVLCGIAPTNEFIEVGAMMEFGNSTRFGDIYRVTFTNNGTVTNDYIKNTLVGSNDTSFTDAVGGNDGVLNNFPTDNSQWVFYSAPSAGVTADVAYTVSAPTFTSTASATLPAPTADVGFTVNAPIFSVSADATLPQPVADVALTIDAPTFSASASVTTPGFNASVNFAITPPTFSASASVTLPSPVADIGYTVSAPTFNVSADASLPQPSSGVFFTVGSPSFSATATVTEPSFNASVS